MEKRYQVFVSSTYADLKEERQKVTQTLMEMDCIPAGMELFPAADEEQWEFIKQVINDCDYYLLIIGGRYGTTTTEGISFTEKEYDYAINIGLKVIVFIHGKPDLIPEEKCDQNSELIERLNRFKNKVSTGRMVKHWENPSDLPGMVALSLQKTIKRFPKKGWIRTDNPQNEAFFQELGELRKENANLKNELVKLRRPIKPNPDKLADLSDQITIEGKHFFQGRYSKWYATLNWKELFASIAPFLDEHPNQELVKNKLTSFLRDKTKTDGQLFSIDEQYFQTIKIQFKALDLIETKYLATVSNTMAWFWYLTLKGEQLMYETRAIQKKNCSLITSNKVPSVIPAESSIH